MKYIIPKLLIYFTIRIKTYLKMTKHDSETNLEITL